MSRSSMHVVMPRPNKQARVTWEGTPASMLAIQTTITAPDGAELKQIHISEAADNAAGVFLATWASWSTIAHYTSTSALAAVLPGRRSFEVDEPSADKLTQGDVVIHDPILDKRLPRAITLVQLGNMAVRIDNVKSDTIVPEPGTPLELILEVDGRAADEVDPKRLVKTFVADALLAQGTPNRLYVARMLDNDPHLLYCAKIRVNDVEASSLLAKSGEKVVFTRLAAHSQGDSTKCVLVWLSDEGMSRPNPLQSFRALRTQHPTIAGLCRSRQHFGFRVPLNIAGAIRIALDVQKARQMQWNPHIVPTHKFVVRGLPATMTDVEVTNLVYNGFQWPQIPLKRVKATALGSAVWLVGALEAPKVFHQQLGDFLVTIERASQDDPLSKKSKSSRIAEPEQRQRNTSPLGPTSRRALGTHGRVLPLMLRIPSLGGPPRARSAMALTRLIPGGATLVGRPLQ
eukprot:3487613-Amphidinium_carterae.2